MNLFECDFYLHFFAFAAWRSDYEHRQAMAAYQEGLPKLSKSLADLGAAAEALSQIWSEIDWDAMDSDEDEPNI